MKRAAVALAPLLAASAVVGCGGRSASGPLAVSVAGNGVSPRVVSDVRRTLERQAPAICAALRALCRFTVYLGALAWKRVALSGRRNGSFSSGTRSAASLARTSACT